MCINILATNTEAYNATFHAFIDCMYMTEYIYRMWEI